MDMCDRCVANALIEVRLPSGALLLFCGHHFRENKVALLEAGATVLEMAVQS